MLEEGIEEDQAGGQEDQKKAIAEGWERINRSGGGKRVEEEGKTEKLFPYNVIGKECRHCHCFFNSLSQTKKVFSSRKKEVSLWVLGKLKVIWTRCLCSHRRHWRRTGMKTKRTKKAIGEGWKRIAEVGDKSFSKLKGWTQNLWKVHVCIWQWHRITMLYLTKLNVPWLRITSC